MTQARVLDGSRPRVLGAAEPPATVLSQDVFVEWQIPRGQSAGPHRERWLRRPPGQDADEEPTSGPTVLICDDDGSVRLVYRLAFEREAVRVREAGDGEECVETALRERPQLIVLDLYLPGMGGLATLKELRERCPEIPVIVVSGRAMGKTFRETRLLGARLSFSKSRFQDRIPDVVRRYCTKDPEPAD